MAWLCNAWLDLENTVVNNGVLHLFYPVIVIVIVIVTVIDIVIVSPCSRS